MFTPKTAVWQERWLKTFRETGNVLRSCEAAGISRPTAYNARKRDPVFAQAWADAEEDACDLLEEEARRRAVETSDTLLIFLLKAHRPEKYREVTRHDVLFGRMNESDLDAYIERQLAEAGPGGEDRPGPPALPEPTGDASG